MKQVSAGKYPLEKRIWKRTLATQRAEARLFTNDKHREKAASANGLCYARHSAFQLFLLFPVCPSSSPCKRLFQEPHAKKMSKKPWFHAVSARLSFLAVLVAPVYSAPAVASGESKALTSDHIPAGLEKSEWKSIRAAHDGWLHEFREVDGGWQARNPGQQWITTFDGRGFLATPAAASWTWGLELKSYGTKSSQWVVEAAAESLAAGQRLTYHWQSGLEEWFVNDERGLEHGYTVPGHPAGARKGEALVFTLATLGNLRPSVASDRQTVHFRDETGAPVLHYSGLKVWDADGKILPSRFEQSAGMEFLLVVEAAGARYPVTIDPIAQQAYVKASNPAAGDRFGCAVAVSGDTVVVGANAEDSSSPGVNGTPNESASNSGAAYVFVRSGSTWSQQAYLKASNPGVDDLFGTSVAVSGDTVVVGARGEDSSTPGVNKTPK